jgi:hypothetical protein
MLLSSMSPRWHPKACRVTGCDAPPDAISARGYCLFHGTQRMVENNEQLNDHRGPFFERWYESVRLAFEHPRVLDESQARD